MDFTKLDGADKSEAKRSSASQKQTIQIGVDENVARDAAIFLMYLRKPEGLELMKSQAGRSVARACAKIVHETEWADVLWPEPLKPDEAQALREAKQKLKGTQLDYWSE